MNLVLKPKILYVIKSNRAYSSVVEPIAYNGAVAGSNPAEPINILVTYLDLIIIKLSCIS